MFTHWRRHTFSIPGTVVLLLSTGRPGGWSQDLLGSRVNGLMTFDFSDNYITPRGLHVEDEGLVTQPLVLLFWKLRSSNQGSVADVTLATGVWNSFHSERAGVNPSRWNEVDPILGLTVKFRKGFTVDAGTTAFYTPTDSYATSAHADFKLTYNDSWLRGVSREPLRRVLDGAAEQSHRGVRSRDVERGIVPHGRCDADLWPRRGRSNSRRRHLRELRERGLLSAIRRLGWRLRSGGRVGRAEGQRAAEVPGRDSRCVDRVRRRQLLLPAQRRTARRQSGARQRVRIATRTSTAFRGGTVRVLLIDEHGDPARLP